MGKIRRDYAAEAAAKMAEAEAEKKAIDELRTVGGDAAVREMFLDKAKERDDSKKQGARRENKGFTQVYEQGWNRLRTLINAEPQAARLYAFFAQEMGPDGTLCASRATLAEALECTERTVSRHVKTLENLGALVVLKVGTANVYCLNPDEVWKSFDNAKPYAAFNTRTLVGKTENPFVKRRLATLLNGRLPEKEQKDFLDDLGEDVEEAIQFSE